MTVDKALIKIATNPKVLEAIKKEFGIGSPVMKTIRSTLKSELIKLEKEKI